MKYSVIFVSTFLLYACNLQEPEREINPFNYKIVKEARGKKAAVASAHPLASEIGLDMMKKGGNAFDAAIATQLALAVVYPNAGNLGGGGFLVGITEEGQHLAIDFREAAPAAAHRDMYLDSNGDARLEKSQFGHLAAGIPGTVAGLFETARFSRLPFGMLIQPAIDLAEKGFVVTEKEAAGLNHNRQYFQQYNTAEVAFIKAGKWQVGDTLIQKDLAETLKTIRDKGRAGFYEGPIADLIVEEMKRGNGIVTREDLKKYRAIERKPLQFNYSDYSILTMPLPSSGGIIMQQVLGMIQLYGIDTMEIHSPEAVQLIVEAERRAFADRAKFMGDPDFVDVPIAKLTNPTYLKKRMADYKQGTAGSSTIVKAGQLIESEETTHLSVADEWGNVVAVTTTLNGSYGSKTVVGGAGFLLNNEMDDFSVKPGVPNMYGAIGTEANAVAGGKRMLSSMTPTILLEDGEPVLVVGTPGGTTIPTSIIQSILNETVFNLSPVATVTEPKFHHQWYPDEVFVERDYPEATITSLEKMGYKITKRDAIGRTELIKISRKANKTELHAVADTRGDDSAAAY